MTAKEYLGQAYRIDQRINSKMEQIASLVQQQRQKTTSKCNTRKRKTSILHSS